MPELADAELACVQCGHVGIRRKAIHRFGRAVWVVGWMLLVIGTPMFVYSVWIYRSVINWTTFSLWTFLLPYVLAPGAGLFLVLKRRHLQF